ncbi:polymyxin B resistance protein pmrD [Enterobacter asburiae]|uniref:polymyxin B resistance protein pmrD n=1 Tax=Enterobacter asburiae TaxID=61645 RepID=UPI0020765BE9|nr:polymyxin B resistance protein pmrD [Enterobacter asburiae]MCM7773467.1 polymyxin B resistance protein pmrD [Enterobacter asburiae]
MEWLVTDVVYLKKTKNYALVLHGGPLKMIAEVTTDFPVQPGDILYPVRDALYLINKTEDQHAKAISAVVFSATHWRFIKKKRGRRRVTVAN